MKLKLFCIPFAGASAQAYYKWNPYLPDFVELCPVELAGRGELMKQKMYESIDEAVENVYDAILPLIDDSPYALFGHSMGSIIVYELAHTIAEKNVRQPLQLFFSGHNGPHMLRNEQMHLLPDDSFVAEIVKLGGLPPQIVADDELMNIFMPIIRQDVKNLETYVYKERLKKLTVETAVFFGRQDKIGYAEMTSWRQHVESGCRIYGFDGGHFFITEQPHQVVQTISEALYFRYMAHR